MQRHGKHCGAIQVELALVLPIVFAMVLGLFEFARLVMIRQLVDNAAREGARLAVVSTNSLTTQNIQDHVIARMAGQTLQNISVQVYKANATTGGNIGKWTDAGLGECIAVEVTGNYTPIVPKITLLPNPLIIKAKSLMYSEAN
jgi:Flp pilus assembly protein TadG